MSIATGAVTARRFIITGELPIDVRTRFLKAIRAHAFLPIDPNGDEERSAGWVRREDPDNGDVGIDDILLGDHLLLALRIDTLKPPAAEVRRLTAAKVKQLEIEGGRRLARREIKLVKANAIRELRARVLPRTTTIEADWDLGAHALATTQGRLRVWSLSKTGLEIFEEFFVKTFGKTYGLTLELEGPGRWAAAVVPAAQQIYPSPELMFGFQGTRPGVTSAGTTAGMMAAAAEPTPTAGAEGDDAGDEETDVERIDLGFLGREFLTWLVKHVEVGGGKFDLPEGVELPLFPNIRSFEIGFGDRLELKSLAAEVGEAKITGETPADSADLRFAIAGGLTVRSARIILVAGKMSFSGMVIAGYFDVRSLKLPQEATKGKRDRSLALEQRDLQIEERLGLLSVFEEALQIAFFDFLSLRLTSMWPGEIDVMRGWLIESLGEDDSLSTAAEG